MEAEGRRGGRRSLGACRLLSLRRWPPVPCLVVVVVVVVVGVVMLTRSLSPLLQNAPSSRVETTQTAGAEVVLPLAARRPPRPPLRAGGSRPTGPRRSHPREGMRRRRRR